MGVRGSGGVGGGVPRHRPSHVAYYVALVGILTLLIMLLLYFFYFFIKKVKKLSTIETPTVTSSTTCRPAPSGGANTYPVQPVVRESASEMARLCKQLPPPAGGKGGTVFPTSTSPAAIHTDTGETLPGPEVPPVPDGPTVPAAPEPPSLKPPVPPVVVTAPCDTLSAH